MSSVTDKIEHLIQPILDDLGYELVDIEFQREQRGWTLRIYLDKEGGITLDDCSEASREISTLLDVEDVIASAYQLEVSSPGIERPLKRLSDFDRFAGSPVKIKTIEALDPDQSGKRRRTFKGVVEEVAGSRVVLRALGQQQVLYEIDFELIEKANLLYEF
jgi:ribosome maturation factor RimP